MRVNASSVFLHGAMLHLNQPHDVKDSTSEGLRMVI